ncbi:helix-turn-helix transcriptional regulator [Streptomyces sp. SID8016]|uniref:helix-turn-helix domain-containing protein n=1 Tax=Streptomyces TaxID=1883 RepID=UPI0013DB8E46|nr:helix-turn-helix domain-containing protein [Streptomyces sp. SID8016]
MATPEAVEFAALLKDLKARSGRSYGVLAGKLHVSTSTLHRYCNGDAVPNEFAPVERFARVCGASGDELVEVHRRWIIADAARRRPPAGASDAGAGGAAVEGAAEGVEFVKPAPSAGSTGSAGPASPVDSAGPASSASPAPSAEPAGRAVEPAAPAEPAAPVAAAVPAAAEHDRSDEPDTGDEDFGTDITAERGGVGAGGRPGEGARSRWARLSRRTRVLIAAAGVAALLVPTTVVAVDLVGSGKEGGGSAADRVEDRSGGLAGAPEGTVSATPRPSVSPSSASPSAGASASGKPSGTPSTASGGGQTQNGDGSGNGAGAGAGGGGGTGLGAPPTVSISSYNWEEPCGQHYLVNQGPENLDPPPPPQDRRGWAAAYGGVEGGLSRLQLTVQGTSRDAVVLKGMHVRVLSRKAPLPWSAYLMGNGCGSGITPQTFASHLDAGQPTLRPVAGTQGDIEVPAVDFPYKVTSEDVEVFNLEMKAVSYDVTWYLELEWSSGGKEGVVRIDDHGKPFRLSGMKGRPEYRYGNEEVGWFLAE